MVLLTKKIRVINGSYYFLIDKDVARECRIDEDSIIQVDIKVIKKIENIDSPTVVEPITINDINKSKQEGDNRDRTSTSE